MLLDTDTVKLDWIRPPVVSLTIEGFTDTGSGRLAFRTIVPVKWLRLLRVIQELYDEL